MNQVNLIIQLFDMIILSFLLSLKMNEHKAVMPSYRRVRKVHATHIMLDRRTTIMAFIECTDFH